MIFFKVPQDADEIGEKIMIVIAPFILASEVQNTIKHPTDKTL